MRNDDLIEQLKIMAEEATNKGKDAKDREDNLSAIRWASEAVAYWKVINIISINQTSDT